MNKAMMHKPCEGQFSLWTVCFYECSDQRACFSPAAV